MHHEIIQLLKQINKKDAWDIIGIFAPIFLSIMTIYYTKTAIKISDSARKDEHAPLLIFYKLILDWNNTEKLINLRLDFENKKFDHFELKSLILNGFKINISNKNKLGSNKKNDFEYISIPNIKPESIKQQQINIIRITYIDLYQRPFTSIFTFNLSKKVPREDSRQETCLISDTFIEYD